MRSRAVLVCCVLISCVMLYLASTAGRASDQDRAVTTTKGDEERTMQVESATVEGDESEAPIQIVPLPPDTVFERDVVLGEGAYVTAGETEQLIYSNTLGTFASALGAGNLVADDITTIVPGGCKLRRYEFPVVGKVDPAGLGGAYTVDFAMYTNCPGSVGNLSVPGLIIPGTRGQRVFPDDAPRLISFVAPDNISLQTNMWFGVKFSRNNAGVIVGTPPLTGFSCDKFDFPGFACNAGLGTRGFPNNPQASLNLEIYADSACANSFTGYKNSKPSGSTFNPGAQIFLVDDIQLSASGCNMIAYEVAVRGNGNYSFEMRNNCESGLIAGTQRAFSVSSEEVKIARFTFNPAIAVPRNLWLAAKVNNSTGGMVIAGQQACIGVSADLLNSVVEGVCNVVPPTDVGVGIHGAFNLAVTCAGPAPVGSCCDMIITQCVGGSDDGRTCCPTNADISPYCFSDPLRSDAYPPCTPPGTCEASCRELPQTNCPFPERFSTDRPVWVQGAECEPDPFQPHPCGVAACCTPDDDCENLTLNECNALPPLDSLRQWQRGRYCNIDQQRCPRIACLARTGECTRSRCTLGAGVCDNDRPCVGGLNPGTICTTNANCRVCSNKTCIGNRVCSKKKCSGSPLNTVCTGDGQGTCPVGQTCNFINCTSDTPCLATGGTCPAAVSVCTGDGQGTCPPNQTCSFITCSSDSPCLANGGTCPPGGVCGPAPNICTAGIVGLACTTHNQCPSGVCNLTTHICACTFDEQCDCPDFGCIVDATCCDSCPPIGCDNPECCTNVCNIDVFCCTIEWDDSCAAWARQPNVCDIIPANDVCAPERRLEGALEMTTFPPNNIKETDSGRATTDASDPGFGCYLNDPGKQGLQTVWYKFVATHTTALLQTCFSNSPATDSLLGVFAVGDPSTPVTQCNSLIPVGCSDDIMGCSSSNKNSKVCVRTIPGNWYYVMVAAKVALQPGKAYRLDISAPCTTPPLPPPGDFCPDALTVLDGTTAFDLEDATMTAPVENCIPTMTNDKWYEYMASCSGLLAVEACGAVPGTTTNLAIYEDCKCPPTAAPPIGCRSSLVGPNCGLGSELKVDVVEGSCYGIRLADDLENRPSGSLKIACAQADCPAGQFTFTDPPNGVVDAARPHDPNNAALLQGIQTIKATGPRDALASCFTLCETASSGSPNSIANIVQLEVEDPPGTFTYKYTITLTRPITAGELTTITYTDAHSLPSTGRFTSHPGNVNSDTMTLASDVDNLLALLTGVGTPIWEQYSVDINRSGRFTPADLLEEVDLMTDGGPYDPPVGGWDGSVNQSDNPTCP